MENIKFRPERFQTNWDELMSLECSENLETKGNIKLKMFFIARADASKYEVEFSRVIATPHPLPSSNF